MVRLGVVGCGRVFWKHHAPALRRVKRFQLVGLYDVDASRCEQAAQQFAEAKAYRSLEELLENPAVDAIAVLTPPVAHADAALAALEARKHVLIEKPLATSVEACDRLIATRDRCGRVALVCHNLRWHPLVRRAKLYVQVGQLGEYFLLHSIATHRSSRDELPVWRQDEPFGAGILLNEAVHHFDLWRYLTGAEVAQAVAMVGGRLDPKTEAAVVVARLTTGLAATGIFGFGTRPANELELWGTAGSLRLCLYRYDGWVRLPRGSYPGDLRARWQEFWRWLRELPTLSAAWRAGGLFQQSFVGIWQHFADCIESGVKPEAPLEDGRAAVAVARQLLDSLGREGVGNSSWSRADLL